MNTRPNPYVGPRSLDSGDKLYGRDTELDALEALLLAERVVLLHSPSGAGKTSLIRAGLIGRLEKDFLVLPPVRVNSSMGSPVPAVLAQAKQAQEPTDPGAANRYLWSTLLSLEEVLPLEQRRHPDELATLDLDTYLRNRPRPEGAPNVEILIFDQFEEILTVSATDQEQKHAFFAQLGAALKARHRWALFAIREDYLGALAPYLRPMPGRLKTTYRLDLLNTDAARQAIQGPPQAKKVIFNEAAAQRLVNDLSRVQTQDVKGATREEQGEYIEPVQLQVVCFNLWQNLADEAAEISEADLLEIGSVDDSLAQYYTATLERVVTETGAAERDLRAWFDANLLTGSADQPVRGQVRKGENSTEGLPNPALDKLVDAHLIRAEPRAGATWFELAHDRLIQPVKKDNAAWFEQNLSLFQRQAILWIQQGRSEGLLLRGKELAQAEKESEVLELTQDETTFLETCQAIRKREQREQRRNSLMTILAISATIAMIVAGIFYFRAQDSATQANQSAEAAQTSESRALTETVKSEYALKDAKTAEAVAVSAKATAVTSLSETKRQATIALAGRLWSSMQSMMRTVNLNQNVVILLGIQSIKLFPMPDVVNFFTDKKIDLSIYPIARMIHTDLVNTVAFSPDGKYIVSGSNDQTAIVWDAALGMKNVSRKITLTHQGLVYMVAFSSDGKYVVSGSSDGTVRVWEASTGTEISRMPHDGTVTSVAFSPDGKYVVSGSSDSTARVWETATGREISRMTHGAGVYAGVYAVIFSSDGKYVVSGSIDKTTRVWDAFSGKEIARIYHEEPSVFALAFSSDGKYVLSGTNGNTALVWDVATGHVISRMTHLDLVTSLAFSPDGKYAVSGGADGIIHVWQALTGREIAKMTHDSGVTTVTFSPDGKYVVSGSNDKTVRVWEASTGKEINRMNLDNWVSVAIFSPDGKYVASGGCDKLNPLNGNGCVQGSARVWETLSGKINTSSSTPEDLIANICASMPRNLTRAEWQQYIGDALPYQAVCPNLPIDPEPTPTSTP